MKRDAPRLTFLILSEDSALDACEPIEALLKRMLLFVDPATQICEERCGAHLHEIKRWAADRGALDEIPTPKRRSASARSQTRSSRARGIPRKTSSLPTSLTPPR